MLKFIDERDQEEMIREVVLVVGIIYLCIA